MSASLPDSLASSLSLPSLRLVGERLSAPAPPFAGCGTVTSPPGRRWRPVPTRQPCGAGWSGPWRRGGCCAGEGEVRQPFPLLAGGGGGALEDVAVLCGPAGPRRTGRVGRRAAAAAGPADQGRREDMRPSRPAITPS